MEDIALMLASASTGSFCRIFLHPLDTMKARLQVQTSSKADYSGFIDAVRQTATKEGIKGFYRGFGVTFLGSMPASCIYFTCYEVNLSICNNIVFE